MRIFGIAMVRWFRKIRTPRSCLLSITWQVWHSVTSSTKRNSSKKDFGKSLPIWHKHWVTVTKRKYPIDLSKRKKKKKSELRNWIKWIWLKKNVLGFLLQNWSENVLVNDDMSVVKLFNFQSKKAANQQRKEKDKPFCSYIAPELYTAKIPFWNEETDIFSFGMRMNLNWLMINWLICIAIFILIFSFARNGNSSNPILFVHWTRYSCQNCQGWKACNSGRPYPNLFEPNAKMLECWSETKANFRGNFQNRTRKVERIKWGLTSCHFVQN